MRSPRTLVLYLGREILLYASLAFAAVLTLLASQHLLRRLDDLLVVGLGGGDLLAVFARLVPMLTTYALPIAFLFGVTIAVARLAADSEILAMRASGLGLREMMVAPLLLALVASAGTAWLMHEVEPAAQRGLRTMLKGIAARGGILEPGKFRDILGRVVFVEGRDRENRLRGIVIEDRSSQDHPFLIFAESGRFRFDPEAEEVRIELRDGDLHAEPTREEELERSSRVAFERMEYRLDVSRLLAGRTSQVRPREMSSPELRETIELLRSGGEKPPHLREDELVPYELQWHRRMALPAAPILFALLAVPIGLGRIRGRRSFGLLVGAVMLATYYSLLTFAELLALDRGVAPGLAMWMPNVLALAAAVLLLRRARGPER